MAQRREPDDVLRVPSAAGNRLAVHVYRGPVATAPVLIVLPAMGTPARFYGRLADALTARGLNVAVADQRAHGDSTPAMSKHTDFGYAAILEEDLPRVYDAVQHSFRGSRVFLLGHSLGGQLALLFAGSGVRAVAGVVVVAAGTVWWRAYGPGPRAAAMLGVVHAIERLTRAFGYWPGRRFRFGGTQPATLMTDWTRLGRTGRFEPRGALTNLEAGLAAMRVPVLGVTVANDAFAPRGATEHLLSKARSADVERWHYAGDPGVPKPDHFAWARHPEPVAENIADWVSER